MSTVPEEVLKEYGNSQKFSSAADVTAAIPCGFEKEKTIGSESRHLISVANP